MNFSDEQLEMLMAHADGLLPLAEQPAMEKFLAENPAAARLVEMMRRDRARLSELYNPIAAEPVPQKLIDAVMAAPAAPAAATQPVSAKIVSINDAVAARRRKQSDEAPRHSAFGYAIAATVAGVIGFGAAYGWQSNHRAATTQSIAHLADGRLVASGELLKALQSARSLADGSSLRTLTTYAPVISFRQKSGEYCRQFAGAARKGRQEFGLACRNEDGGWQLEMLTTAPVAPEAGVNAVRTAGKKAPPEIERLSDTLIVGDALGREDEERLIKKSWSQTIE